MATAPNPKVTIDLSVLGNTFKDLLKKEAANFIQGNVADVAALGEDLVTQILTYQTLAAVAPQIPPAVEGESVDIIALREEILLARSQLFQLIEKANAENAVRIARVRSNAISVAGKIASTAATVLGGVAVKVLLGL